MIYTPLHPHIYEINEQYFYSSKVHTYLLDLKESVLLFDLPTYAEDLEQWLLSFGKPLNAILSHGSCGIEDGEIWQEKIGLKVYGHQADENHPWIRMKPDVLFVEMPFFDENVEVIHTPGHSAGSICVLEKTTQSLFTGDTIYGNKEGKIRDIRKENYADYENIEDRLKSCQDLLKYDFKHIYPFHYEILEEKGKGALRDYLSKL